MNRKLLWLLLVSGQVAAAPALEDLDVFELEVASDVQISPDGRQVAYVRRSMDIMADAVRSNIWVVDVDGANHRPLFSGPDNFASPRWSPAADRIAYITMAGPHGAQLHVRWMDTGQTALLTQLRESPADISWSPDGRSIAFSSFVEREGPTLAKPAKPPKGAKWAPGVRVIDRLRYRAEGLGYLRAGNSQVFVIPAEGGTPRQLTSGEFDHGGRLAWSPDGKTLVLSANRNEDWETNPLNSDLWSVDLATGALLQLTDRDGPDGAPAFSPDGKAIAYLGFDDRRMGYHNAHAYVLDLASGDARAITGGLDRSVGDVHWAGDSRSLLVRYDDFGKRVIARVKLDGTVSVLADDVGAGEIGRPYTSGDFTVGGNGAFAYSMTSVDRPADVGYGTAAKNIRRLTDLNGDLVGHRQLGEVEEIAWSGHDGLPIQGWVVKPPEFDAGSRYPLILEIHGGPFAAYGPHFSVEAQLYAAAGYVVLYANPRGSTSYGYDFANEIHHNYPGEDYLDLLAGVDAMVGEGYVDEDQLFVTGGSGGGVLTAWIVGKTDRFKAAVAAKPVINWTSEALYSDITAMVPRYWFDQPPWEDQESYWRRSPLSLVGNVKTPTMLLTGEVDYRTPIAESEQYFQALKLQGVDTLFVRVPEASHSIYARPSHLIAKVNNILAWFEKYRAP